MAEEATKESNIDETGVDNATKIFIDQMERDIKKQLRKEKKLRDYLRGRKRAKEIRKLKEIAAAEAKPNNGRLNIKGLPKKEVLVALFDASTRWHNRTLTVKEAERILKQDTYIKVYDDAHLDVELLGDTIDTFLYNRYNERRAEDVIAELRIRLNIKDPNNDPAEE